MSGGESKSCIINRVGIGRTGQLGNDSLLLSNWSALRISTAANGQIDYSFTAIMEKGI
ncbi:MAG: hypothetical protein ACJ8MO_14025 [Bacillus sp. (in: firmicutes)]